MRAPRIPVVLLAVAAVSAACAGPPARKVVLPRATTTTTLAPTATTAPAPAEPAVRLVSYNSCDSFLSQVKAEALSEVTPYGLPVRYGWTSGGQVGGGPMAAGPAMAAPGGAAMAGASGAGNSAGAGATGGAAGFDASGPAFSTTNNQEAGVDEPDLAKTDGRIMVTLRSAPMGLQVLDLTGKPRMAGFLPLPEVGGQASLLLAGGNAVVLGGDTPQPVPAPSPGSPGGPPQAAQTSPPSAPQQQPTYQAKTRVVVVAVSDPDHPRVVRSFTLDGDQVGARLVGARVELVLQSVPNLPLYYPPTPGLAPAALAENRRAIEGSTVSQWLPSVKLDQTGATRVASCGAAMHPTVASGLGTVSVISLDPNSDTPGHEVTVVGNASTVYANTTAMYVATARFADQPLMTGGVPQQGTTTDIHGFDLTDPTAPRYVGTGVVTGAILDQYSLSEYGGYLRVASTVGQPEPPPREGMAPQELSDNLVTILHPAAGVLAQVGQVSGLGRGEKIYGVRFLGALGYVVTFRQTDPLYVVDLSDPSHPALKGQLELPGYSAYLHPVGNGLLLGLGRDVDANLRTTGVQLSLFDVSDPAHPVLKSRIHLENAWTTADTDHHQFLYWAPAHLAVIPLTQSSSNQAPGVQAQAPFQGAVGLRVDPAQGISEVGRLTHAGRPHPQSSGAQPGYPGPGGAGSSQPGVMSPCCYSGGGIQRSIVVGDVIYTVSEEGVLASDLASFADMAWLPYGG